MKSPLKLIFSLLLTAGLGLTGYPFLELLAQTPPRQQPPPRPAPRRAGSRVTFKLSNVGAPGRRSSGGTRSGLCTPAGNDLTPLMALVPELDNTGLTSVDRPSFWFYIPYASNPQLEAEFSLKNRREEILYRARIPLSATPGIIQVKLPDRGPVLEPRERYFWRFQVSCNPDNRNDFERIEGAIERHPESEELRDRLQAASGRDRLLLEAENGLWYDLLTHIIELRQQAPQDEELWEDWQALLQQKGNDDLGIAEINLAGAIDKPILPCCTAKE